jgi:hypothetical protein
LIFTSFLSSFSFILLQERARVLFDFVVFFSCSLCTWMPDTWVLLIFLVHSSPNVILFLISLKCPSIVLIKTQSFQVWMCNVCRRRRSTFAAEDMEGRAGLHAGDSSAISSLHKRRLSALVSTRPWLSVVMNNLDTRVVILQHCDSIDECFDVKAAAVVHFSSRRWAHLSFQRPLVFLFGTCFHFIRIWRMSVENPSKTQETNPREELQERPRM